MEPPSFGFMPFKTTLDVFNGFKYGVLLYGELISAIGNEKGAVANRIDPSGDALRIAMDRTQRPLGEPKVPPTPCHH